MKTHAYTAHHTQKKSRDGRSQYRAQKEKKPIQAPHPHMNRETNLFKQVPRTQRPGEHMCSLNGKDLMNILIPKLEAVKRKQELEEKLIQIINEDHPGGGGGGSAAAAAAATMDRLGPLPPLPPAAVLTDMLQLDDDSDQAILDQHVSRVWSDQTPHRSPGTVSPGGPDVQRRRMHDALGDTVGSTSGSMRHSRSMPEHHTRRLTHKWASVNTDSGISMYSSDLKNREPTSRFVFYN